MRVSLASLATEPTPDYLRNVALAESLGYDAFFHNDNKWRRDVWVRLGAAAATTSRIGLGISVADPYTRHPALTAQATATLAEFAPGRFVTVFGAGSHFDSLPDVSPRKPLAALRESLTLLRALWAGERVTLDGEIVRFRDGKLEYPPPEPPAVWIAGRGEKVLALAGEIADGVLIGSFATPRGIAYALEHVGAGVDRAGRARADLTVASWLYVSILEHEDEPIPESVLVGVAFAFWSSRAVLTGMLDELASEVTDEFREFLRTAPHEWRPDVLAELKRLLPRGVVDTLAVVGTREQVESRLAALAGAGVDHAVVWPFPRPGTQLEQYLDELADGPLQRLQRTPVGSAS